MRCCFQASRMLLRGLVASIPSAGRFDTFVFQDGFHQFPGQFKGKFKTLDGCIEIEVVFVQSLGQGNFQTVQCFVVVFPLQQ